MAALGRRGRELGTLGGLLALCLLLTALTPYFLTVSNLLNVMEQTSINAVIAVTLKRLAAPLHCCTSSDGTKSARNSTGAKMINM